MSQSKSDREKQKFITDKCQSLIEALLKDDENKYCVDCDSKGPRWASWNLGVFLCIRCAGIHRNLGVHISRVKSVNLDAWTPDHVAYMQRMGNARSRAIFEANLPEDFRRPQTDTALESFIRAKYEHKKYIAQDYVDPGPPLPAFNIDDELKKLKEQRRSKASASSASTRILSAPELPKVPTNTSTITSTTPAKTSPSLVDFDTLETPEAAPVTPAPAAASAASTPASQANSSVVSPGFPAPQLNASIVDLLAGPDLTPVSTVPMAASPMPTSTADLLAGLVSSPVAAPAMAPQASHQTQPDKVLTKESILSLYSNSSRPNTTTTSDFFSPVGAFDSSLFYKKEN